MTASQVRMSGCPDCGGRVTEDPKRGEFACTACGTIIQEQLLDHGPEWTAHDAAEYESKARVGPPITETLHDRGLSTVIDWRDKDAHGNTLSARKRRQMHRLRTWNIRSQTSDSQKQYRKQGLAEIDRMAAALGLPTDVRETASVTFRRAHSHGIVTGRSIESVAAAALHIGAAMAGLFRTLDEIETVARVSRTRIARAKRAINAEFDLPIEPGRPVAYLDRFGSQLELDADALRLARRILETAPDEYLGSGASPVAIAAAALYLADDLTGGRSVSQRAVSETCGVCIATIQTHHPRLRDGYQLAHSS